MNRMTLATEAAAQPRPDPVRASGSLQARARGEAGVSYPCLQEGALMLFAEGLVKRYRARPALDGFDLAVAPGEIAGLIGPDGAGKTTFVEVVTGLVRPDAGQVLAGPRGS